MADSHELAPKTLTMQRKTKRLFWHDGGIKIGAIHRGMNLTTNVHAMELGSY